MCISEIQVILETLNVKQQVLYMSETITMKFTLIKNTMQNYISTLSVRKRMITL